MSALDSLHDYALAAFFARLESVPDANQSELARLLERAKPLRENLLRVADGLAGFGPARGEPLVSKGVELGGTSPSAQLGLPGTNRFTSE